MGTPEHLVKEPAACCSNGLKGRPCPRSFNADQQSGDMMKRDWDLIRAQLTAIEEERDFEAAVLGGPLDAPKWKDGQEEFDYAKELKAHQENESRIFGHLELLIANGFVTGVHVERSLDGFFQYSMVAPRLTMAGHDLLDTMRSETLWATIKATAKTKGLELTFDSIKALGIFAMKGLLGG